MKRHNKILLTVLGVLVFGVLVFSSGGAELFQGRLNKNSKPLPAYDENKCNDSDEGKNYEEAGTIYGKISRSEFGSKTDYCNSEMQLVEYYCDGKFIKDKNFLCKNGCSSGACKKSKVGNVSGALDTLVVVDTDFYDITENDVKEIFKIGEDFWLKPKTNIGFNLSKIIFISLGKECPQNLGNCDPGGFLTENFPYFDKNLPEFIVFFTKDGIAGVNGGSGDDTYYFWLDPAMSSFYKPDSQHKFCTEFPVPYNSYTVASPFVDYKHKYAICGYDQDYATIVSNTAINGQCKNQVGTPCVLKNGYQMCSNMQNDFFAQNPLYLSAKIIVHELLHSYGDITNGDLDHFGTYVCNEAMGEKMQKLEDAGVSAPFHTLFEEYAGMCPNVWENFKKSQKSCE